MTKEPGNDLSYYQWPVTLAIVEKLIAAGRVWFQVRVCQGRSFVDPRAREIIALLHSFNLPVGPYIFVTKDDADLQYRNYVNSTANLQFELIPWMDVEYYTASSQRKISNAIALGESEPEVEIVTALRYASPPLTTRLAMPIRYSIASQAIVDSLGRKIKTWMTTQPKMSWSSGYPAIYTNVSSGNAVFTADIMSNYPLAVAYWSHTAASPLIPNVWKRMLKPYYTWQKWVEDGRPFGFTGGLDYNEWGLLFQFPGSIPPPEEDYFDMIGKSKDGVEFVGRAIRVIRK